MIPVGIYVTLLMMVAMLGLSWLGLGVATVVAIVCESLLCRSAGAGAGAGCDTGAGAAGPPGPLLLAKKAGVSMLVSEATRTRCGADFEFTAAAPLPVQGKPEPVATYVPQRPPAARAASVGLGEHNPAR